MPTPKRQSKAPNLPELLTTKEAAVIAGVSVRRLQKWVEARRLRTVQRRPKTLIERRDLDDFLRQQDASSPVLSVSAAPEAETDEANGTSRLLTAKAAAAIAKVHPHTIQKWVARDHLRAVQRRPKTLIERRDLDDFLRHRTPPPQTLSAAYDAATDDAGDASQRLTAKQAAAIAKVHPSSVRAWVREGRLDAVQQQPLVLIDPAVLDAFLRDRTPPPPVRSAAPKAVMADTGDPVQEPALLLDVLPIPAVDTPNDAMWRALVLVLQRELEATKAREARLLDLLDQATRPTPRTQRRLKVSEMTLVHRVRTYLESAGRPQRAWQVQQALKLDKPPYRELSRLVARGQIQRLREGVYAAVNLAADESP